MSAVYDEGFTDDLVIDVSGGEVDSVDELYSGGNYVDHEGMYHASCTNITVENSEDDTKLKLAKLEFTILAGIGLKGENVESQINRLTTAKIYLEKWENKYEWSSTENRRELSGDYAKLPLDEKGKQNVRAAAYGLGLMSESDLSDPNKAADIRPAPGCQVVVKVTADNSGKFLSIRWASDILNIRDERVKDVPRDLEAMAMLGNGVSGDDLAASGL